MSGRSKACGKFERHWYLYDQCKECNFREADHNLVVANDAEPAPPRPPSPTDRLIAKAAEDGSCRHFIPHLWIIDKCRDCGKPESVHATSEKKKEAEISGSNRLAVNQNSRNPEGVPFATSGGQTRWRGVNEGSGISGSDFSSRNPPRTKIPDTPQAKPAPTAFSSSPKPPRSSSTSSGGGEEFSVREALRPSRKMSGSTVIFDLVNRYEQKEKEARAARDFLAMRVCVTGVTRKELSMRSKEKAFNGGIADVLRSLDVDEGDVEITKVSQKDQEDDLDVRFLIRKKDTNIPLKSLQLKERLMLAVGDGSLEDAWRRRGLFGKPYLPSDPTSFGLVVGGTNIGEMRDSTQLRKLFQSIAVVLTDLGLSADDLSVEDVCEGSFRRKGPLGAAGPEVYLANGDLAMRFSIRPGVVENLTSLVEDYIRKAIEAGSMQAALQRNGLEHIIPYDYNSYPPMRKNNVSRPAVLLGFILVGISKPELLAPGTQKMFNKAIGETLANVGLGWGDIDLLRVTDETFPKKVLLQATQDEEDIRGFDTNVSPGELGQLAEGKRDIAVQVLVRRANANLSDEALTAEVRNTIANGSMKSALEHNGIFCIPRDPFEYAKEQDERRDAQRPPPTFAVNMGATTTEAFDSQRPAFKKAMAELLRGMNLNPDDFSFTVVDRTFEPKLMLYSGSGPIPGPGQMGRLVDGDLNVQIAVRKGALSDPANQSQRVQEHLKNALANGSFNALLAKHKVNGVAMNPETYADDLKASNQPIEANLVLRGISAQDLRASHRKDYFQDAVAELLRDYGLKAEDVDIVEASDSTVEDVLFGPGQQCRLLKNDCGVKFLLRKNRIQQRSEPLQRAFANAVADGSLENIFKRHGLLQVKPINPAHYGEELRRAAVPVSTHFILGGADSGQLAGQKEEIKRAMAEILRRGGVKPEDVDFVSASNDRLPQKLVVGSNTDIGGVPRVDLRDGDVGLTVAVGGALIQDRVGDIEYLLRKAIEDGSFHEALRRQGVAGVPKDPEAYAAELDRLREEARIAAMKRQEPVKGNMILRGATPDEVRRGWGVFQSVLADSLRVHGIRPEDVELLQISEGRARRMLLEDGRPTGEVDLGNGDIALQFLIKDGRVRDLIKDIEDRIRKALEDGNFEAGLNRLGVRWQPKNPATYEADRPPISFVLPKTKKSDVLRKEQALKNALGKVLMHLGLSPDDIIISELNDQTYSVEGVDGQRAKLKDGDLAVEFMLRKGAKSQAAAQALYDAIQNGSFAAALREFGLQQDPKDTWSYAQQLEDSPRIDYPATVVVQGATAGDFGKAATVTGFKRAIADVLGSLGVSPDDVSLSTLYTEGMSLEERGITGTVGAGDVGVGFTVASSTASQAEIDEALRRAIENGALEDAFITYGVKGLPRDVNAYAAERAEADRRAAELAMLEAQEQQAREAEIAKLTAARAIEAERLARMETEAANRAAQLQLDQALADKEAAERKNADLYQLVRSLEDAHNLAKSEAEAHALEARNTQDREAELALLYNQQLDDARARARAELEAAERDRARQLEEARKRAGLEAADLARRELQNALAAARAQAMEEARRQMAEEAAAREAELRRRAAEEAERRALEAARLRALGDIDEARRRAAAQLDAERAQILDDMRRKALEDARRDAERRARDAQDADDARQRALRDLEAVAQRALDDAALAAARMAAMQRELDDARRRAQQPPIFIQQPRVTYVPQLEQNPVFFDQGPAFSHTYPHDRDLVESSDTLVETGIELTVSCRNLLQMDWLSMVHPLIAIFEFDRSTGKFHFLDQTEWLRNTVNPIFETTFEVEHAKGTGQELMFRVYDVDAKVVSEKAFLGAAVVDLDRLLRSGAHEEHAFPLTNVNEPLLNSQLEKEESTLLVKWNRRSRAVQSRRQMQVELEVRCQDIPPPSELSDYGFVSPTPVASIFLKDPSGTPRYMGQTEKSRDPCNPTWNRVFLLDLEPDEDIEFKVSVYDTNTDKVREENRIGSSYIKLRDVSEPGQEVRKRLINETLGSRLGNASVIVRCIRHVYGDSVDASRRKAFRTDARTGQQPVLEVQEVSGRPAQDSMHEVVNRLETMMVYGRNFRRYFAKKRYQYVSLFYIPEKRSLCWCAEGKREENPTRMMALRSISGIVIGKQCPAFNGEWIHRSEDRKCLSIVAEGGQENVLHLEARSEVQRDAWIFGLTSLMKQFGTKPVVYKHGQWKDSFQVIEAPEDEIHPAPRRVIRKLMKGKPKGAGSSAKGGSKQPSSPPGATAARSPRAASPPPADGINAKGDSYNVEISIRCTGLPRPKNKYKVASFEHTREKMEYLEQTDYQQSTDPEFRRTMVVRYRPKRTQRLRFQVHDPDGDQLDGNNCLVYVDVLLSELAESEEIQQVKLLMCDDPAKSKLLVNKPQIIFTCKRTAKALSKKSDKDKDKTVPGAKERFAKGCEMKTYVGGQRAARIKLSYKPPSEAGGKDKGRVWWCRPQENTEVPSQSLGLADITSLHLGKQSFDPSCQGLDQAASDQCFTLRSPRLTLHLECANRDDCNTWVTLLKSITGCPVLSG